MSQHSAFTPSGIVARILSWMTKRAPQGTKIFFAACYGIVELLGVSQLARPAINATLYGIKEAIRARQNTNKK